MNPERDIFAEALEIASPEERAAFVRGACRDDDVLLQRVDSLLRDHGDALEYFPEREDTVESVPLAEGVGSEIGRYKLLQKIGEGGFGIVYMAEQREPVKRRVALKIIKLGMDTKQVVGRFEAERQALAMMDHPHIAKVLDAGATDTGRPYFVMELVSGISITKFCDEERLTTGLRIDLFLKVCAAIQHAHQKGVIHRDIKPSNVLVTMLDDRPAPKVIDFGIAKATQQELTDKTLFTRYEEFVGTPSYMSPEQMQFNAIGIDTRSDIYALGVLLYELLTGSQPFNAKKLLSASHEEIRRRIREELPPKPSTRVSRLSGKDATILADRRRTRPVNLGGALRGDLDSIVMKALEKDRSQRYESASSLARDLERYRNDQPIEARPPSLRYRLTKLYRRRRGAFAVALVVLVALAACGFGLVFGLVEERKGRAAAEASAAKAEATAAALAGMILEGSPYESGDYSVHQMLLDYEEDLSRHLRDYPEMEAKLRRGIGFVLGARNQLSAAEESLKEALSLAETTNLKGTSFIISTRESLANVYKRQRKRDLAIAETKRVLDLKTQLLGPDHPETLRSRVFWLSAMRNTDGSVLSSEELLARLEDVADRVKNRLDEDAYATTFLQARYFAITIANRLGHYDKSERYCSERFDLLQKKHANEPNHPSVIATLQHKAEIARLQGNTNEALAVLEDAKRRAREWFGEKVTPYGIDLIIEETKAHRDAKNFEMMESAARSVVTLAETHLEVGHPFLTDGAILLAHALREMGRPDEADEVSVRYKLK